MTRLIPLLLLCACSSSAPTTYQRGTSAPTRPPPAPTFNPSQDAPHTTGHPGHVRTPQSYPQSSDYGQFSKRLKDMKGERLFCAMSHSFARCLAMVEQSDEGKATAGDTKRIRQRIEDAMRERCKPHRREADAVFGDFLQSLSGSKPYDSGSGGSDAN